MIQSFNSLGIRWFHKHAPQVLRGQLSSALTRTNPENPFLARFLCTVPADQPDLSSGLYFL